MLRANLPKARIIMAIANPKTPVFPNFHAIPLPFVDNVGESAIVFVN